MVAHEEELSDQLASAGAVEAVVPLLTEGDAQAKEAISHPALSSPRPLC